MEPAWGQKCSQLSTQIPYLAPSNWPMWGWEWGVGGWTMDKALTPLAPGHSWPHSVWPLPTLTCSIELLPGKATATIFDTRHQAHRGTWQLTTHTRQNSQGILKTGDVRDRGFIFTNVSCGSFPVKSGVSLTENSTFPWQPILRSAHESHKAYSM